MFKVKFDMTEGRYRRVANRTAAVMRPHSSSAAARRRYGTATTSGAPGHMRREAVSSLTNVTAPSQAGADMSQRYSPVFERAEDPTIAEDFMPADPQTQHKIFRNLIMFDPIAGPATEYWKDLAFSQNVILSGIDDNEILEFYQDAIDASGIISVMPMLLSDYLTFGKFVFHMIMDKRLGYWTETIPHDLDYVSIKVSPIPSLDPIIDIQPTQDMREWAISSDERIVAQRRDVDPVLVSLMAAGRPIPLAPENTMFLPRRVFSTDYYGTSYLTRIMPFKIYEKALLDASIAGARRRAGPLWHIKVWPDATDVEMSEVLDLFFAAEEDPIGGKVVTREGVEVIPVGGGAADFWKLSDEWQFLSEAKMRALGISETFLCLAGDTYLPTKEHGIVQIGDLGDDAEGVGDIALTVGSVKGAAPAKKWKYSGYADTLRVITKRGYSIQPTYTHEVLVLDQGDLVWRETQDLSIGDLLCVSLHETTRDEPLTLSIPEYQDHPLARNTKMPTKPEQMTPVLAFILGLVVSEGCHDRYRVRFFNSDTKLNEHYQDLVRQVFNLDTVLTPTSGVGDPLVIGGVATKTTKVSYEVLIQSKVVANWLSYLGVIPSTGYTKNKEASWHKVVPWSVLQADRKSQLAYLAAYIEGDGRVDLENNSDIAFYSRSTENLFQLQVMLSSFGIVSTHMEKYHRLYVSPEHARKLHVLVSPYLVSKCPAEGYLESAHPGRTTVVPASFVVNVLNDRFLRQEHDGTWFRDDDDDEVFVPRGGTIFNNYSRRKGFSYASYSVGKFDDYLSALQKISISTHRKLMVLLNSNYHFEPVQRIEDAGKAHVYDICMGDGEAPVFEANGLLVHNSGEANYNSMDMILSTFLEKVRAVRSHFTRKILIEKICLQLAQLHGFQKRSQADLSHRIRTSRKLNKSSSPEYHLPTIEWDKPLSPIADRDYLDIMNMLEEKGLPIPLRMITQIAGFDLDKALDSFDSDLETQKVVLEHRRALAQLKQQYGFDETGAFQGSELGDSGLGGELPGELPLGEEGDIGGLGELGGELPAGEESGLGELGGGETGGGGEAAGAELPPAAPTPGAGGGFGADLAKPRFNVKPLPAKLVVGKARIKAANDIVKDLKSVPVWDADGALFGMTQRRVAKMLDRIDHTDPRQDRRQALANKLPNELRRKEGLDSMQATMVQYLAIRLGFVPPVKLPEEAFNSLRKFIVDRMDGNGLTKAVSNEIVMLSKIAEAGGRRSQSRLAEFVNPVGVIPRYEGMLSGSQVLTGVVDSNPFLKS